MKTLRILFILVVGVMLAHCGTTESVANLDGKGPVSETIRTLDTVVGTFITIAESNRALSPGEVLVQTTDWVKSQPGVKDAYWYDSSYIEIEMESGLSTTFMLNRYGADSLSFSRGGDPVGEHPRFTPTKSTNIITNKNVLILSPFVDTRAPGSLYKEGEIDHLINAIKNAGAYNVTYHEYSDVTVQDVESFGNYGLVIISTHGTPYSFLIGQDIAIDPEYDTTEALVKAAADFTLGPGGYEKCKKGYFGFVYRANIGNYLTWQELLKQEHRNSQGFHIKINASFLNSLPPMPNTVIVGNMCYSGWRTTGEVVLPGGRGTVKATEPIGTAFTNRGLISYYSYGYDDGTSAPADNDFCKRMEDSLVRALMYDHDSTGMAHLNASGGERKASQLLPKPISPNMPFKQFGAKDYSYEDCVTEFIDERDGQKYKAVCIGKQNWMAENLRFVTPGSECYDSMAANCDIYGRLYPWVVAMGTSAATNANPSGVRGICPKGWHLPSEAEWDELFTFLGGRDKAGNAMKLKSPLWKSYSGENNSSGFTGIPGGIYGWKGIQVNRKVEFSLKGEMALFHSTTVVDGQVRGLSLQHMSQKALPFTSTSTLDPGQPPLNASCRCVKD